MFGIIRLTIITSNLFSIFFYLFLTSLLILLLFLQRLPQPFLLFFILLIFQLVQLFLPLLIFTFILLLVLTTKFFIFFSIILSAFFLSENLSYHLKRIHFNLQNYFILFLFKISVVALQLLFMVHQLFDFDYLILVLFEFWFHHSRFLQIFLFHFQIIDYLNRFPDFYLPNFIFDFCLINYILNYLLLSTSFFCFFILIIFIVVIPNLNELFFSTQTSLIFFALFIKLLLFSLIQTHYIFLLFLPVFSHVLFKQ